MLDAISLIKRIEKGSEIEWTEEDNNKQQLETAVNYLLAANWRKDYDSIPAGELTVTHNFGLMPQSVTVWIKVTADRWIPVATPDVSYKDSEITEKVYINFPEAVGETKVIIKF